MSSPFVDIGSAMVVALRALDVVDAVEANRVPPLKKGVASAIVVRLNGSQGQRAGVHGGPVDWETDYEVEILVRYETEQDPALAVDDILAAAFACLTALQLTATLSVEQVLPDPSITWDFGEGEERFAMASFNVRVTHRTQGGALVAWNT
ncbi:hypothetical protein [Methylibium sp.]|uniref:hypothetical protein n=1 Tax=Methylibium sp. TaxID=2067992 RepID=UPI003D0E6EC9